MVSCEAGQHQDADIGAAWQNPLDGFNAIHFRHLQIHQDHVRHNVAGQFDRFNSVLGLTYHLDVLLGVQQCFDATAHDRVVVD